MIDPLNIEELRFKLAHGEGVSQAHLNKVAAKLGPFKDNLRPKDKSEALPLFGSGGSPLGTTAPRWVCHLLSLRHRCAHVLLLWHSVSLGDVLVLQVRAWNRDDSPGHLDISVGGHMTTNACLCVQQTAAAEMTEETGLTFDDLDGGLQRVGVYLSEESQPSHSFYNSEWRDVFVARIKADRIRSIHFPDDEVAAMVLVPLAQAPALLHQETIAVASGLKRSLPLFLARVKKEEA